MSHPDVLILGGGIIGCALAEELARRGRRVIVLERGRIGAEASSAAAGILAAQIDLSRPGPLFELCQEARRMYPGWLRRLERASGVRTEYRQAGILYPAFDLAEERVMAARARWQRGRRLRVERWSPALVRRREPALDGRFRCGFFFPAEAQLDNVKLMQALAAACRKAGVAIRERTSVRRLLVRGGRAQGAETDRGTFRAPVVVNCLGSWANLGGPSSLRLPVEPARGQILVFEAPPRLVRCAVMSGGAYMVQRQDGRLLVGSTVERVGFRKALTLAGIHTILSGVRRMSSALDRCAFLEAWAGFRPLTPDKQPILGKTRVEGLYVATGHFRHGILLAPVTARLMAELILDERPSVDPSPFSPNRFQG